MVIPPQLCCFVANDWDYGRYNEHLTGMVKRDFNRWMGFDRRYWKSFFMEPLIRVYCDGAPFFTYAVPTLNEYDIKYGWSGGSFGESFFWERVDAKVKESPFFANKVTHEFSRYRPVRDGGDEIIKITFFLVYCKEKTFFFGGRSYGYEDADIAALVKFLKKEKSDKDGLIIYVDGEVLFGKFGWIMKALIDAGISDFSMSGVADND